MTERCAGRGSVTAAPLQFAGQAVVGIRLSGGQGATGDTERGDTALDSLSASRARSMSRSAVLLEPGFFPRAFGQFIE